MKPTKRVSELLKQLLKQDKFYFPPAGKSIDITCDHGVYILYKNKKVIHVGRSTSGKEGLCQRLKNHLYGNSSFTINHLKRDGGKLRNVYEYQF